MMDEFVSTDEIYEAEDQSGVGRKLRITGRTGRLGQNGHLSLSSLSNESSLSIPIMNNLDPSRHFLGSAPSFRHKIPAQRLLSVPKQKPTMSKKILIVLIYLVHLLFPELAVLLL
jgi:hypothetical protein